MYRNRDDRFWPFSACRDRLQWVDFCQSGPPSVLVKSDANNWSSRMQMSGQVQCKWVVRWSVITQLAIGSQTPSAVNQHRVSALHSWSL